MATTIGSASRIFRDRHLGAHRSSAICCSCCRRSITSTARPTRAGRRTCQSRRTIARPTTRAGKPRFPGSTNGTMRARESMPSRSRTIRFSPISPMMAQGISSASACSPTGNLEALFLEDQFKATSWLTLTGGLRYTHFGGQIAENAADPRIGAAIQIPKLNWVLARGVFLLLPAAAAGHRFRVVARQHRVRGCGFLPLYGERDIQQEYGVTIPIRGWVAERNLLPHLGEEFLRPRRARQLEHLFAADDPGGSDQGLETTVRSPLLLQRYHAHLVYSNQKAQGVGA